MAVSTAELQLLIKARDQASQTLRGVGRTLGGIASTARLAGLALAAVGVAAGGLGAAIGFKLNVRLQQLEIGFTTLLGSAKAARQFMEELKQFAIETPFEFEGLASSAQFMGAIGFEADKVIPMLRIIGDQMAALGQGADAMKGVVFALGQMKAMGKVTAQDMFQLANRFVGAWQFLADALGLSVAEVRKASEKGMIAADFAIEAILKGMQKKTEGQMTLLQGTFVGAWNAIKETISFALADVTKEFTDDITIMAIKLAEFFETDMWKQWLGNATDQVRGFFNWFRNHALPFIVGAINLISDAWGVMGENTKTVVTVMAGLFLAGGPLLTGINVAIKAFGLLRNAIVIAFMSGAVIVAAQVAVIVASVAIIINQMTHDLMVVVKFIGMRIGIIMQKFASALTSVIKLTPNIAGFFKEMLKGARSIAVDIGNAGLALHGFAEDVETFRLGMEKTVVEGVTGWIGGVTELTEDFKSLIARVGTLGDAGSASLEKFNKELKISVEQAKATNAFLEDRKVAFGEMPPGGGIFTNEKKWVEMIAKLREQILATADAGKKAKVSIADMARAFAEMNPAVQLVAASLTAMRDQFAMLDRDIQTQVDSLQNLQDELAAARDRLSELMNPRLTGMGAMDEQIRAVERAMSRLRFQRLGGVLTPDMLAQAEKDKEILAALAQTIPGTPMGGGLVGNLDALQKVLERLNLEKGLTFDEKLRKIQEAMEGVKEEITFEDAITQITLTKEEIVRLESEIINTEQAILMMRNAAEEMREQIARTEEVLSQMVEVLSLAFQWLATDRKEFVKMGGTAEAQATVVDAMTTLLLESFSAFASGEADMTIDKIMAVVEAWRSAKREIDKIAAGVSAGTSAPADTNGNGGGNGNGNGHETIPAGPDEGNVAGTHNTHADETIPTDGGRTVEVLEEILEALHNGSGTVEQKVGISTMTYGRTL